MINRILIRIKVVQLVFSYYLKEGKDLEIAEKELLHSLDKAYELYLSLLLLMIELTDRQQRRIETAKSKFLATSEERNPNLKFVNNRFIAQLRANKDLQDYLSENKISWINEQELLRILLDKIIKSDIYQQYMTSEDNSYEADREFWKEIFKNLLADDPDLAETLEAQNIYWNDDLDIISTFVTKTIRHFEEKRGTEQKLLPRFKDEEDEAFARLLFRKTILSAEKNKELITKYTRNWEIDRVAFMDTVIMLVALTEIRTFPSIPVRVSLNEYIEIAKSYSTPKSGHFINGILDAIVSELKKAGELTKE